MGAEFFIYLTLLSPALRLVLELRDQQLVLFEGFPDTGKCSFLPKAPANEPKAPLQQLCFIVPLVPSAGQAPAPAVPICAPHCLDAATRERTAGRMLGVLSVGCTVLMEVFVLNTAGKSLFTRSW